MTQWSFNSCFKCLKLSFFLAPPNPKVIKSRSKSIGHDFHGGQNLCRLSFILETQGVTKVISRKKSRDTNWPLIFFLKKKEHKKKVKMALGKEKNYTLLVATLCFVPHLKIVRWYLHKNQTN